MDSATNSPNDQPGRRYFIAAGTATYDHLAPEEQLPSVVDDLARMAALFVDKLGYERALPELHLNPSTQDLRNIEDWLHRAERRTDDIVVFYYSGHGKVAHDRHYLCTHETNSDRLNRSAFPTSELALMLNGSKVQQVLILLDTCYAGRGSGDVAALLPGLRDSLWKDDEQAAGIYVLAAAGPKSPAYANLFCEAFIEVVSAPHPSYSQPTLRNLHLEAVIGALKERFKGQTDQRAELYVIRAQTDSRFLPNPHYNPDAPFSQKWLEQRLEEAIVVAGPRYTPPIHVELPIAQYFESLARTPKFFVRIKHMLRDIRQEYTRIRLGNLNEAIDVLASSLDNKTQLLFATILNTDKSLIDLIPWTSITEQANQVLKIAKDCLEALETLDKKAKEEKKEQSNQPSHSSLQRTHQDTKHHLHQFIGGIRKLREFSQGLEAKLSNLPALLLCGEAGQGKTHLFCDIAQKRIADGSPTLLLMGQRFTQVEPWTQIIQQLGLPETNTRDDFLASFQAAAQAKNAKALILLDALNEGDGKKIWHSHLPAMLQTISRYPWISVTVSVRSTYERVIIADGLVNEKIVRVEHPGFADHEYQATRTFFDYYGIVQPSIPLLVPEFQNPLFLKLLCKGLRESGQSSFPVGLQGITAVFMLFVDNVNKKLAGVDFCGYNYKLPIVWRAIDALASEMADHQTDWLSIEVVEKVINSVLPGRTFENSLYRHLISEGVIVENGRYFKQNEWIEVVQFAYEKFSDHLIVKHLLDKHFDNDAPHHAFLPNQPLAFLTEKEWQFGGLIEALCIQLPERISRELPEVAPMIADSYSVQNGFIQSIIWRDSKAINDTTLVFLNKYANEGYDGNNRTLNALLTVATNPEHPFNANFLHRRLMKDTMADRDAWWSIFLHYQYGAHDAVDRLVDWAWSPENKNHIDDKAIRLCGVALLWFLTSSNRFLRDRATKALVNLFTCRINILVTLMEQFHEVNDMYLLERLYAVAYGCALRSVDNEQISSLAQGVYDKIFKCGTPPSHILLREYARGIVEYALHRNVATLTVKAERICPPYQSKRLSIPTKEEIERYKHPIASYDSGDIDWSYNRIVFSVMDDDFARYVIGTNSGSTIWLSLRIDEPTWRSHKEEYEYFIENLTGVQKEKWADFIHARQSYEEKIRWILGQLTDEELNILAELREENASESPQIMSINKHLAIYENELTSAQNKIAKTERNFRRTIGKKKQLTFGNLILPYIQADKTQSNSPPRFDLSQAQRWILKRTFDLGWSTERFGEFDRFAIGYHGRSAHKVERIGKKYQWIAYHEFLARIADNFQYRDELSNHPQDRQYRGTWQLSVRNIDPSCILRATGRGVSWRETTFTWWFSTKYLDWNKIADDVKWIKTLSDLPDIRSQITVTRPSDNSEWLVLDCLYHWEEPSPPEEEKYDVARRKIWFWLHSYLVHEHDCDELFTWATDTNFMGRWMPEGRDFHGLMLGEIYWSPAYSYYTDPYEGSYGWQGGSPESQIPAPIMPLVDTYAKGDSGFDCSIDEGYSIAVPTKLLLEQMGLEWRGVDGKFFDKTGQLIAFDPSIEGSGPKTLLIRKDAFLLFLKANGYCVVWTVLGEKQLIGGNSSDGEWKGRLEVSGAYRWGENQIEGKITPRFRGPQDQEEHKT